VSVTRWLVDTNVVSELRKGRRTDAAVRDWYAKTTEESLFTSVLVLSEIRRGIELKRRRDPLSAASLDRWLRTIIVAYADHVLPIDQAVAEDWGHLDARGPFPVIDGLLAATARVHGLTVVTRNVKDFGRLDVEVVDPFTSP